jgi:hypothetical protein
MAICNIIDDADRSAEEYERITAHAELCSGLGRAPGPEREHQRAGPRRRDARIACVSSSPIPAGRHRCPGREP